MTETRAIMLKGIRVDLYKEIQHKAIDREVNISTLLNEAMELYLGVRKATEQKTQEAGMYNFSTMTPEEIASKLNDSEFREKYIEYRNETEPWKDDEDAPDLSRENN